MIPAGQRILDLCRSRDTTLKAACEACGVRYGTVHRAIKEGRDLHFNVIDSMSSYFAVPIGYFSSRRAGVSISSTSTKDQHADLAATTLQEEDLAAIDEGLQITTDMVLDWLDQEHGILRNYENIRERVDLFHPAVEGDTIPRPARIGAQSLASVFFHLRNEQDYTDKIGTIDPEILAETIAAHLQVQKTSQYQIDDIEITTVVNGERVAGKYRRILAPVTDPQGVSFTLVFARLIQAFQPQLRVQNTTDQHPQANASSSDLAAVDHSR